MAPPKSRLLAQLAHVEHGFLSAGEEPPAGFLRLHQIHSDLVVDAADHSSKADGIMTTARQTIAVQTADCLPVLFAAQDGSAIAAVHAGWRGLNSGILVRTLERFAATGIAASKLVAAIGPAIGRCCFEVSPDVVAEFERNWGTLWKNAEPPWRKGQLPSHKPGRSQAPVSANDLWLDLDRIAELQLLAHGVPTAQIEQVGPCTYCGSNDLASYRRGTHEGVKAGRQWSFIARV